MTDRHNVADALKRFASKGLWFEELTQRRNLSTAIYQVPAGASDPQTHHGEDEVYYVLAGSGTISIAGAELAVTIGDVIDVPAGVEHHFHSITETLQLFAVFAPAYGTRAPPPETGPSGHR